MRMNLAGTTLEPQPDGSLWLPASRTLLIADLHLGKAHSYRRLGMPVPAGTTQDNLAALDAALAPHPVQRLVVLGDFLHSRQARSAALQAALSAWVQARTDLAIVLVRGNHDRGAGDPDADLGIRVEDGPLPLDDGRLLAGHEPEPDARGYLLAGHVHPCIGLSGRAGDRLRLPCFWFGPEAAGRAVGVLPAFGRFTGMHRIEPQPGDQVLVCADGRVHALPAPQARGRRPQG